MKKYFVLIGAAVLITSLITPAGAQMLTKSWGHMEIMTTWERRPDFNTGAAYFDYGSPTANLSLQGRADRDLTRQFISERFILYLQHGDEKTVRAIIAFEADSANWGETPWSETATTAASPSGRMGVYGTDQVQLEIKRAYLEFVVPNTPLTVSAGMQSFQYGGRLFVYNDAPGVKVTGKFAPHQIEGAWWRENDDSRVGTEIRENYALEYRLTQKAYNFYAWGNYLNQNRGFVQDHPYWLGVGGGFKPGNWDFSGQFIYVGGKREDRSSALRTWDYEAFALEAAAKYRIGPGMGVGLEFFYSTGSDAEKTDKINKYPLATSSEGRNIFGTDRSVIFWTGGQFGYYNGIGYLFEGMWYGRANFEFALARWVRFNLNYLYIGDTSKGSQVFVGGFPTRQVNSPFGATQFKDEDFIGHEINLITTLVLGKKFVYYIGLGYFIPGSMYDAYDPVTRNKTKSAEACYGINTNLRYVF